MKYACQYWLLLLFLCFSNAGNAQYILNGSAKKLSCNCYSLTDETTFQSGSVWNSNKINLTNSFDFWFTVNLGCNDATGADGIVFILQPLSTSVGSSGEGMGFGGVMPSIGIALDTWQNTNLNDPAFDHISIQANGVTNHNNDLAGPVPASPITDNIEDCQWHRLRISWDASTKWLRAYFDGVMRVEKQIDLITTIFNNDPNVYWGFTGATGGSFNLQRFCTALEPLFVTDNQVDKACKNIPVQFTNNSESFAPIVSYAWTFGDGGTSNQQNPTHTYTAAGTYAVGLKITGMDGCEKDSTVMVTVGDLPTANFNVFDTCAGFKPRVQLLDTGIGFNYQWKLDGSTISNNKQVNLPALAAGSYSLQLIVASSFNCGPPDTLTKSITVLPKPIMQVNAPILACKNELVSFDAVQLDNATSIVRYQWNFGDGSQQQSSSVTHNFLAAGPYTVSLFADAGNGCRSDTISKIIEIEAAYAFAGNDTVIIKNRPTQLNGAGNGSFQWSPGTGLSDVNAADPLVQIAKDSEYTLTVTTAAGCTATDTILLKVFEGPAIYVANAFTPNGDGRNDVLRPVYVGIAELKEFAVFNRWGQKVFFTNQFSKGWDGNNVPAGSYVWLVQAIDETGKSYFDKGTITIIR